MSSSAATSGQGQPPADGTGQGQPPADGGQGQGGQPTPEALSSRMDTIERLLQQLLDGQGDSGTSEPDTGPGGQTVAQQVQAELDRLERERAAEEGEKAAKDWRAGVDASLEHLKTQPRPGEPVTGRRAWLQRLVLGSGWQAGQGPQRPGRQAPAPPQQGGQK